MCGTTSSKFNANYPEVKELSNDRSITYLNDGTEVHWIINAARSHAQLQMGISALPGSSLVTNLMNVVNDPAIPILKESCFVMGGYIRKKHPMPWACNQHGRTV